MVNAVLFEHDLYPKTGLHFSGSCSTQDIYRPNAHKEDRMAKVAFLGLGVMGYPMAGHLKAKGGHEVTVFNRTAAKADQWVAQHGGKSAKTPKEAAQGQDFVMACVGNDNDLREVMLGQNGAFDGMKKGAILVDHTTASAKMVNQICIAGLVQGLAEGIHFAKKSGLDIEKLIATISKGAAQSWQMENRYKTMAAGKFDFGFAVDWMRKDLGICLGEARKNGAHLPITALVDQFYSEIQAMGGKRWDTSSLIALLER